MVGNISIALCCCSFLFFFVLFQVWLQLPLMLHSHAHVVKFKLKQNFNLPCYRCVCVLFGPNVKQIYVFVFLGCFHVLFNPYVLTITNSISRSKLFLDPLANVMTWPTTLPGIYPKYCWCMSVVVGFSAPEHYPKNCPLLSFIVLFVMKNYKKLSKIAMTSSNSRSNKCLLNWPKCLRNSLQLWSLANGCNAFAYFLAFIGTKDNIYFSAFPSFRFQHSIQHEHVQIFVKSLHYLCNYFGIYGQKFVTLCVT